MLANWVFFGRVIHIFAGFMALSVVLVVIFLRKVTVRHKVLGSYNNATLPSPSGLKSSIQLLLYYKTWV